MTYPRWIRISSLAGSVLATAMLAGCSTTGGQSLAAMPASACADWQTTASRPGQQWWAEQRWRFHSDEEAKAAYVKLATGSSPWPDWFTPQDTTLPVGTRFEMAIGGGQTPDQPGGFGTFDNIRDPRDVYDNLAVRKEWKPQISAVVIYEVAQTLPVRIGPVGPQIDGGTCALLEGRWSQFQMLVAPADRMKYLRVIETRKLP